jgi:DNA sulfur modification protein DndE
MIATRIRLAPALMQKLSRLKGRTGLTPNILCRIALLYSLRDNLPLPNMAPETDETASGVEMNRVTLFGEWEDVYEALVKQWCFERGVTEQHDRTWLDWALIHIERGTDYLHGRVKDGPDLLYLFAELAEVRDTDA